MDLLHDVESYLSAGLSVIALKGKQPNTAHHPHGLQDAISGTIETEEDAELLQRVFDGETTGVGIPIPPHLVVVDIDGEEGAAQFRDLVGEDWEEALDTAVAKTGRGLHLWYVTSQEMRSTKLGSKLDLKGVGGYVAAPPSLHPDGHRYEWLVPLVTDGMIRGVGFLPAGIQRMLDLRQQIEDENHVERPTWYEYHLTLQDGRWHLDVAQCPPDLTGLAHAVEHAEEGNRNNILAWAALCAVEEGATLESAMRDLGGAAEKAGLGAQEIRTTIRAAFRRRRR